MAIGINFGNTDEDDKPIGPFSHWLEDETPNIVYSSVSSKEEIWRAIQNLKESDLRYIETKLSEMRMKQSRKAFADLRRKKKKK